MASWLSQPALAHLGQSQACTESLPGAYSELRCLACWSLRPSLLGHQDCLLHGCVLSLVTGREARLDAHCGFRGQQSWPGHRESLTLACLGKCLTQVFRFPRHLPSWCTDGPASVTGGLQAWASLESCSSTPGLPAHSAPLASREPSSGWAAPTASRCFTEGWPPRCAGASHSSVSTERGACLECQTLGH